MKMLRSEAWLLSKRSQSMARVIFPDGVCRSIANGIETADDAAHAGAGYVVYFEARRVDGFEDTDMGQPFGTSSTECNADLKPGGRRQSTRMSESQHGAQQEDTGYTELHDHSGLKCNLHFITASVTK